MKSNRIPIARKKANEFAFKSSLGGPIRELSLLRRSLLFAEVSMISYLMQGECNAAAGKIGFSDGKMFQVGGIRAHWFQNEYDSVIVFRGFSVDNWKELKSNISTIKTLAETVGHINQGFKSKADRIWPGIEQALEINTRTLWFCGHSIGGALANICAGRCMLSYIQSEPEALFSFGSPRIGCRRYVHHVDLPHHRWVNHNDIVAREPPVWASYRHSGIELYLDRYGQLMEQHGWQRFKDRILGMYSMLRARKIDSFPDHSIFEYIDHLFNLVRAEENK